MNFNNISFSDKLTLINLVATLASARLIEVPGDRCDEEDIIDFLAEKASYLLNKSDFLQKTQGS